MSKTRSFLFEIGSEELPPKSLKKLSISLHDQLIEILKAEKLLDDAFNSKVFATPRRLAVYIDKVYEKQPDQVIERRGPSVAQAFDEHGQPTPAATGFAKSVGVEVSELGRQSTDKGEWLFYKLHRSGQTAHKLIPDAVSKALKGLPIAKRMRWGSHTAEFIRPVKWIVMLYGDEVIDSEILSIKSDRFSFGHRFHAVRRLRLRHADDYETVLDQQGMVSADFDKRRAEIDSGIKKLAEDKDAAILLDENLLDEVTGLVELPVPLLGNIDQQFMSLPEEVLISSMQDHQKYFPLVDKNNKMLPYFITVSNIRSKDESSIIKGNERVIRARLSDAQFFYSNDKKQSLTEHAKRLSQVLFHKKLGTLDLRVARIAQLSGHIAQELNIEKDSVMRAGTLAKADLVTDMVGEFPDLQGIMGKYYALNDGETNEVAQAIEQHYWPKFAGDDIPESDTARVLSIADKLDTICGIFAASQLPSGDRDPFGLRRAALGILRIVLEAQLPLDLDSAIEKALESYQKDNQGKNLDLSCKDEIYNFIFERLKTYYQAKGYDTKEFQAVAALKLSSALDFDKRIKAVHEFVQLQEASSLIEANKRIKNILQKTENIETQVNASALELDQEKLLFDTLESISEKIKPMLVDKQYDEVLKTLAQLKEPVDEFFDKVMVMDEDMVKRSNRIALLDSVKTKFNQIADIALLK